MKPEEDKTLASIGKLLNETLRKDEQGLLEEWMALQAKTSGRRMTASEEKQLETRMPASFWQILRAGHPEGGDDISKPEWSGVRDFLSPALQPRAPGPVRRPSKRPCSSSR